VGESGELLTRDFIERRSPLERSLSRKKRGNAERRSGKLRRANAAGGCIAVLTAHLAPAEKKKKGRSTSGGETDRAGKTASVRSRARLLLEREKTSRRVAAGPPITLRPTARLENFLFVKEGINTQKIDPSDTKRKRLRRENQSRRR